MSKTAYFGLWFLWLLWLLAWGALAALCPTIVTRTGMVADKAAIEAAQGLMLGFGLSTGVFMGMVGFGLGLKVRWSETPEEREQRQLNSHAARKRLEALEHAIEAIPALKDQIDQVRHDLAANQSVSEIAWPNLGARVEKLEQIDPEKVKDAVYAYFSERIGHVCESLNEQRARLEACERECGIVDGHSEFRIQNSELVSGVPYGSAPEKPAGARGAAVTADEVFRFVKAKRPACATSDLRNLLNNAKSYPFERRHVTGGHIGLWTPGGGNFGLPDNDHAAADRIEVVDQVVIDGKDGGERVRVPFVILPGDTAPWIFLMSPKEVVVRGTVFCLSSPALDADKAQREIAGFAGTLKVGTRVRVRDDHGRRGSDRPLYSGRTGVVISQQKRKGFRVTVELDGQGPVIFAWPEELEVL